MQQVDTLVSDDDPVTTATRTVLAVVGAVLALASAYVERRRERNDQGMQALSAFAFAGGVASAALAMVG